MAFYYCNTCNVLPIEGARFHCNMCADFDECGKCRADPASTHDATHTWTEHDEDKVSLSSSGLGYALGLLNSCAQHFGHSVPYGPAKQSGVLVEEVFLENGPLCAFVCMSASMGVPDLRDDVARVEYTLDKFRKLRRDFPGGKHTPCCRLGQDDTALEHNKQCPRCCLEMRTWMITLRISCFYQRIDLLGFFLATEKKCVNDPDPRVKAMIAEGGFTADVLVKAWEEATPEEKVGISERKKGIMDYLEQTYQWPLDLAAEHEQ